MPKAGFALQYQCFHLTLRVRIPRYGAGILKCMRHKQDTDPTRAPPSAT